MAASQKRPAGRRRKKRYRRPGKLAWILSFLALAACAYFLYELITIDILPMQMLMVVCLILLLVLLILILLWLTKTRTKAGRLVCGILVCALGICYGVGGYYVSDTAAMFNEVTNMTDKTVNSVTTYAMLASGITRPDQMNNVILGVLSQDEEEEEKTEDGLSKGSAGALQQLRQNGATFTTVEYPDPYSLVDALYNGNVTAIAFPEAYHDAINEVANDYNKYNALTTFTNSVDQYIYYSERTEVQKNPADPVNNIMTDPFVVLISGADSYGSLSSTSRSDVNMLVAVNPSTAQILILSIPRDTYTAITCKKNQKACDAVNGLEDKLTHAGIYGVGTSESTIEDLLDIEINYTVRVNFSSLINLVDAIGGVDVEVEPGLEVERFYSNGTEGVTAGINHLNGERALAFSRERYAYIDGDNQRVRNQQIVMKALMKAMMSPAMVVNYPKVMKALSTAFETNMSAREAKSLLTLELLRFPKWNIQNYSLSNESTNAYSPVVGDWTSVTIADESQLQYAHDLIEDLKAGRTISVTNGTAPSAPAQADPASGQDYGAGESSEDPYGSQYGYSGYEYGSESGYGYD